MAIQVDETEITVDGISYTLASLSPEAMAQLTSLRFVNAELARLRSKQAVYGTARIAYERALTELLPRKRH